MAPSKGCELTDLLVGVLSRVNVPVSLSFINSSLSSILQIRPKIDDQFITARKNLFVLTVIGNDLKIALNKDADASNLITDETAIKVSSVIEKDHRKVQTLVDLFAKEGKREILFEELITKYSSNKRQINVSFVVRNSHSFCIFAKDDKTYVKIVQDDDLVPQMNNDDIQEHLESCSLETIMVRCLWSLLSCFYEPVNLGNLQSCYRFGSIIVDSGFLSRYRNIFQSSLVNTSTSTASTIELRSECREMDAWAKKNHLLPKVESHRSVNESLDYTKTLSSECSALVTKTREIDMEAESAHEYSKSTSDVCEGGLGSLNDRSKCPLPASSGLPRPLTPSSCNSKEPNTSSSKKIIRRSLEDGRCTSVESSEMDVDCDAESGTNNDIIARINKCVSEKRSFIGVGCHDMEPVVLYASCESDNANRLRILRDLKAAVKREMEKNVKLLMENIS